MSTKSDQKTPGRERPPADSSDDFFSVGAPLHAVRAGYVRRRADDLLYEALVAGHYAHVIAPDRSGKSSLIAAVAARLEANGFNVAILDLDQIGIRDAGSDAGRWYYSVAYRILRQLRIRFDLQSWWQDKAVLGNRQRLLEFYNEIVLRFVQERIVIFVDGIQCTDRLGVGDQLLSSVRSAHNARTTDPEFSRLAFVLLGECDPVSLIDEPELSPFNVTQAIPLHDFTRDDLNLFAAELNLDPEDAELALDRIYYWTRGQPYLTQKLARATAREGLSGDIAAHVDRIVRQQLTGRAALHNEPQLSHIHREILRDEKHREALLNLYGRLRKGVAVATDLGSPLQRRLMAVGLLRVDDNGELRVRNRVYGAVFTARWANENLPTRWRVPLVTVAALLLIVAIPFWYTQWLPAAYVDVLTSSTVEFDVADTAWRNLRSFPGHATTADRIYRNFLQARAQAAGERGEIETIATMAADLPQAGNLPNELRAAFWDRSVRAATRLEQRDDALIAALESLILSTPQRRRRAAMLVGDDYPMLLATLSAQEASDAVFDPDNLLLTSTQGSQVMQWSLTPQGLQQSAPWAMTALEVSPLVRRVIVDREGQVNRVGLTLNISHPRLTDLRIKVIAPSGRTIEIETGLERASSSDDIRIPAAQMRDLIGEQLNGTWTLSVRDEALGVAGHLVGWNLTLNSQGAVEDFQRGLHIPDPVEKDTDNFWISRDGRYAVARALQSDSARVWDLAFAKPIRAIAVGQNETLIGLDKGARRLVTATLETVNVWDTTTGDRVAAMQIGSGSVTSRLTGDGQHLFVQRSGDADTRLELWSLEDAKLSAQIDIAGSPALVALDSGGTRIAVADFDRAVRIWDFRNRDMLAQLDLPLQPSAIEIAAGGKVLGVTYGTSGVSLWHLDRPTQPMIEERSPGRWQLAMSPSGNNIVAGRPRSGYQIYRADDGFQVGPTLGSGGTKQGLLLFSSDERVLLTGGPNSSARFWRAPTEVAPVAGAEPEPAQTVSTRFGDAIVAATPDASGIVIGDRGGHVYSLPADVSAEALAAAVEDVSFLGHDAAIRLLTVSPDGRLAASGAADDTVRTWDLGEGRPLPYMANMPGGSIAALEFSPDASMLAVLSGTQALILDTRSGDVIAEFQPGEVHGSVAFADADHVYIGSESGALRVIGRDTSGAWSMQQLWQGSVPIRWLRASSKGQFLVLVDRDNLAQQFNLAEGRVGTLAISLPDTVEDVAFNAAGSRVFFRTARWIQRASSSANGLIWLDAVFGPRAMSGAGIVVGAGPANDIHVPVVSAGSVSLRRMQFSAHEGPGLFGNKDALLQEWRMRLGLASEFAASPQEAGEPTVGQPPD